MMIIIIYMQFLKNIDYNNIDKGIEFLKKNELKFHLSDNEETIYHVYWYGEIKRKQICCINSYLATQDLSNTKLWVWLDYETFELSENKVPKHNNIIIKKYVPDIEAKDTLFEGKQIINQNKFLKFRSDLARIIFLHKYGGLYYDLDMILLKDLKPLLGIEFCYAWSTKKEGNNGILRIKKNSELSNQLIQKYLELIPNKKFVVWYNQFIFTNEINIINLPSVLFDPVWILHDLNVTSKYSKLNNLDNFFRETDEDISNFFDNKIYAYHWHSRSNYEVEKNSYFERIELMHLNKLNNKII